MGILTFMQNAFEAAMCKYYGFIVPEQTANTYAKLSLQFISAHTLCVDFNSFYHPKSASRNKKIYIHILVLNINGCF